MKEHDYGRIVFAVMQILKSAALYFVLVFGVGFVLGPIRVLWAVPRFGERTAELMEAPFMLVAIVLAARWIARRFVEPKSSSGLLAVGFVALALLVATEMTMVLSLRGLTFEEYVRSRDPVAGGVYVALLLVFALMPMMTRTLILTGLLLPLAILSAPARADDDFGVNVEFYRAAHEQAETMAAAGIHWVRIDLAWSASETEPGRYDFRIWDRFLDSFEPHGIRVLFVLDYGNNLYEDGFPPSTEVGRAAFAAFAGASARHFRGRAAWEIWNEPNLPQYWAGSPDPAAYVALARAAAAEIRRGDPEAWILGPSLGGDRFDLPYLEATFALGLLDVVDAVSVHPYGAPHPEAATGFYDEVRRLIAHYAPGRTVPVVVSEWGYPVEGLGAEGQADFLVRALAVNRRAGIPLTIWYNWQEPITPWHSFGLLDVRGRPKPAYIALTRPASASASGAQPKGRP